MQLGGKEASLASLTLEKQSNNLLSYQFNPTVRAKTTHSMTPFRDLAKTNTKE